MCSFPFLFSIMCKRSALEVRGRGYASTVRNDSRTALINVSPLRQQLESRFTCTDAKSNGVVWRNQTKRRNRSRTSLLIINGLFHQGLMFHVLYIYAYLSKFVTPPLLLLSIIIVLPNGTASYLLACNSTYKMYWACKQKCNVCIVCNIKIHAIINLCIYDLCIYLFWLVVF